MSCWLRNRGRKGTHVTILIHTMQSGVLYDFWDMRGLQNSENYTPIKNIVILIVYRMITKLTLLNFDVLQHPPRAGYAVSSSIRFPVPDM